MWRSRLPIIFRSTGGCVSASSLNAWITLSAFAKMLSVGMVVYSPARISSRGCGPGSCARAKTIIPSSTQESKNNRLTYLLGYQKFIKYSLVQMYQGVLRNQLLFREVAETGYWVSASRK